MSSDICVAGTDDFASPQLIPELPVSAPEQKRLDGISGNLPLLPVESNRHKLRFHAMPCATVPWEQPDQEINLRLVVELKYNPEGHKIDLHTLDPWILVKMQTPGDPQVETLNHRAYQLGSMTTATQSRVREVIYFPVKAANVGLHPVILQIVVSVGNPQWQLTHTHPYIFACYCYAQSVEPIRRRMLLTDRRLKEAGFLPGGQARQENSAEDEESSKGDGAGGSQEAEHGYVKPKVYNRWRGARATILRDVIRAADRPDFTNALREVPYVGPNFNLFSPTANQVAGNNLIPLVDKRPEVYLDRNAALVPLDQIDRPSDGLGDDPEEVFAPVRLNMKNFLKNVANNLLNQKVANDFLDHFVLQLVRGVICDKRERFKLTIDGFPPEQLFLLLPVADTVVSPVLAQPEISVGAFTSEEALHPESKPYTRLSVAHSRLARDDSNIRELFPVVPQNVPRAVRESWTLYTVMLSNRVYAMGIDIVLCADVDPTSSEGEGALAVPSPEVTALENTSAENQATDEKSMWDASPADASESDVQEIWSDDKRMASRNGSPSPAQPDPTSGHQQHQQDIRDRVLTGLRDLMNPLAPPPVGDLSSFASSTPTSVPLMDTRPELASRCNPPQQAAIDLVAALKYPFVVVQGPPGTRKTYNLGNMARDLFGPSGELTKRSLAKVVPHKVVGTAPTNNACDALACSIVSETKDLEAPPKVLRIYSRHWLQNSSVPEDLNACYCLWDDAATRQAHEHVLTVIEAADIIVCTVDMAVLRYSALLTLTGGFAACIIDEAGRVGYEFAFLLSTLAQTTILGGDFRQLEPFIPAQLMIFT
ncbi:MAG: AAA domain-containing protein, partial [Pseudomonadota bacterium]